MQIDWSVLTHKSPFLIQAFQSHNMLEILNDNNNNKNWFYIFPWVNIENYIFKDFIDKPKTLISNLKAEQNFLQLYHIKFKNITKIYTDGS